MDFYNDLDEYVCPDPDCECWEDYDTFDDYTDEDKWLDEYEDEPCQDEDCPFCP